MLVSFWISVFFIFFWYMPNSEIVVSYGNSFLLFCRTSILFLIVTTTIYIPTNSVLGFPILHILISSVHFRRSVMSDSAWTAACQASLSITVLMSLIGDAIQPSHPLVPFSRPQPSPASWSFPMSQLFTSTTWMTLKNILGTYWHGEFIFQCHIFSPFHTARGVLRARILKWFAIPFSNGPHFVRTLHYDPSILGGPTWHGS